MPPGLQNLVTELCVGVSTPHLPAFTEGRSLLAREQGVRKHACPFHIRYRDLRARRGWSREVLTDEAGLDRTYGSGIPRMVTNPTVTVIDRVAIALKCTLGALVD